MEKDVFVKCLWIKNSEEKNPGMIGALDQRLVRKEFFSFTIKSFDYIIVSCKVYVYTHNL